LDVEERGAMPTLIIKHITTYRYRQPVAFGEHWMMLRPRDSHDQSLVDARLLITPTPTTSISRSSPNPVRSFTPRKRCRTAWAQVYLPGPGWVDLGPSSGIICNRDLVRVAVVHDPRQAIPLRGTWTAFPSDYLGMDVEVVVTSDAAESEDANANFATR
jgi:hypothetical protein